MAGTAASVTSAFPQMKAAIKRAVVSVANIKGATTERSGRAANLIAEAIKAGSGYGGRQRQGQYQGQTQGNYGQGGQNRMQQNFGTGRGEFGSNFGSQDSEDFEPDYRSWRQEQMRALDDDYRAWRQDNRKRFSDEFTQWRNSRRSSQGQQSAQSQSAQQ